jgi:conjugative transfer region protein TrbK
VETRTLATIGAIALAAIALVVTALDMRNEPAPPPLFAGPQQAQAVSSDPLAPELRRCNLLGEAAERDSACLAVWDQNRRRFLGEGR